MTKHCWSSTSTRAASRWRRSASSGTLSTLSGSASAPGVHARQPDVRQDDIDGTRVDADGSTTVFLRRRYDLDGSLPLAGISATQVDSTDFAIRTNPHRAPDRLRGDPRRPDRHGVRAAGHRERQGAEVGSNSRDTAGDAWEDEQHLDLTDPDNLAAAQAFLRRESDSGDLGALAVANRALAVRLALGGVEQLRTLQPPAELARRQRQARGRDQGRRRGRSSRVPS